jgi:hypothetical protein
MSSEMKDIARTKPDFGNVWPMERGSNYGNV